ncbi:winged helix-turn-helix transcriptional regulator [Actinomadura barringtoniae]|uniref:Winged helix-turn-helix transcriptional regulator n=1 Tax=Actinomadura barringtoniae TaxID=1427535 RepID=A0A939PAP4_9ACTN|nr:MarR family winged helix-turn-helix transcriptional regulator [Actinomadura barringtoniae]MBO2449156.1 winged helix-turn-helix transcriptional regulator [Actinomadura barringtoniae]
MNAETGHPEPRQPDAGRAEAQRGRAEAERGRAVAERARLTSAQLAVWRSLVDTTDELKRLLGARLAEDTGLSPADYRVLLTLWEAPGRRLRSSALAAAMDWERSRLSHHIGRMDKRGLVGRENPPNDNRGAEVVLTSQGAAAFRTATAPHARAIRDHFAAPLSDEQLAALDDILTTLHQHLHAGEPLESSSGDAVGEA